MAEGEARSLRHNYIGTEHLLLALAAVGESVAARALVEVGVGYDRVREHLLVAVPVGDAPPGAAIGLTPRAKRSIELAVEAASRLKHQYVGSEHLLLGLAALEDGVAASDARPRSARARRRSRTRSCASWPARRTQPAARSNVVACRVDDAALAAIEALVEAGIRQTRSDAAAWLIQAGIEANADLFERVHSHRARDPAAARGDARGRARAGRARPAGDGRLGRSALSAAKGSERIRTEGDGLGALADGARRGRAATVSGRATGPRAGPGCIGGGGSFAALRARRRRTSASWCSGAAGQSAGRAARLVCELVRDRPPATTSRNRGLCRRRPGRGRRSSTWCRTRRWPRARGVFQAPLVGLATVPWVSSAPASSPPLV